MRIAALRRLGLRKTAVGLSPFVWFFSATFGAGVNASHCPITCPKRRIQPERYMPFVLRFSIINYYKLLTIGGKYYINNKLNMEKL
jgi:hypothetical protein